MSRTITTRRLSHSSRACPLALAAVVSGALLAGCGGSASRLSTATGPAASPRSTLAAAGAASGTGSTAAGSGGSALAFAKCMRADGVPDFPDPSPTGGALFTIPAGSATATPALRAAQARCTRLLPGGGLPGAHGSTHASDRTLVKLVAIARCMRQHGVPQFPDPETSLPSHRSGLQEITDFDGAILVFPATINLQSPAYRQALARCGAPPLGLRH